MLKLKELLSVFNIQEKDAVAILLSHGNKINYKLLAYDDGIYCIQKGK